MTKIIDSIETANEIDLLISTAKLEYLSDISWGYKVETPKYVIDFYQDETGKNHIEQFARFHKGHWFNMTPTNKQAKLMFSILNATPYREEENDLDFDWNKEPDSYESTGTSGATFY